MIGPAEANSQSTGYVATPQRELLDAGPTPAASSHSASGRLLVACLIISAAVRIASTANIPLIISNDSVGYFAWAEQLFSGKPLDILPHRTPGYPLFLAGVFHLFGISSTGILVIQHVLAWAGTAVVFWIARLFTRPALAFCAAILYSLDPWMLGVETFALTETLTWFLILVSAGLVWFRPRGSLFWALLLGAVLAFASLTRPTCQLLIPFLLFARILKSWTDWRRGLLTLLAGGIGVVVVLAPWLRFNENRGIKGLASGSGAQIWIDLQILGILHEPDFDLPEDVARLYRENGLDQPNSSEDQLFQFLYGVDAFNTRSDLLGKWARHSIRAHPREYLEQAAYAVCWQLKLYPPGGRKRYDDLQFYLARAGESGGNFQFGGQPENIQRFAAYSDGGFFRKYLRACDKFTVPGMPAVPLFIAVVFGVCARLLRRDWPSVLVILGTLAFMFAHALLLSPMSRYTLPLWPVWYATGMIVLEAVWRAWDRMRDVAPSAATE